MQNARGAVFDLCDTLVLLLATGSWREALLKLNWKQGKHFAFLTSDTDTDRLSLSLSLPLSLSLSLSLCKRACAPLCTPLTPFLYRENNPCAQVITGLENSDITPSHFQHFQTSHRGRGKTTLHRVSDWPLFIPTYTYDDRYPVSRTKTGVNY